jgi:hypothetical protein
MLKSEVAQLLAKAALIDNRKIDAATVETWHELIGHVDYDTAMAALTIHRRTSSEYLLPSHIIANLRKAREKQTIAEAKARAITATPNHPPTNPNTYRARNPELWDHLLEQGKQARQADLKARGRL